MGKDLSKLKQSYADLCNEYLRRFCEAYEFSYEDACYEGDAWVANDAGTIACVGDYYFDFSVIKYCVDNGLNDWKDLSAWYDYTLNASQLEILDVHIPNYPSWHRGCPRVSNNKMEQLLAMKYALEKEIDAVNNGKSK